MTKFNDSGKVEQSNLSLFVKALYKNVTAKENRFEAIVGGGLFVIFSIALYNSTIKPAVQHLTTRGVSAVDSTYFAQRDSINEAYKIKFEDLTNAHIKSLDSLRSMHESKLDSLLTLYNQK